MSRSSNICCQSDTLDRLMCTPLKEPPLHLKLYNFFFFVRCCSLFFYYSRRCYFKIMHYALEQMKWWAIILLFDEGFDSDTRSFRTKGVKDHILIAYQMVFIQVCRSERVRTNARSSITRWFLTFCFIRRWIFRNWLIDANSKVCKPRFLFFLLAIDCFQRRY